MTNKNKNRKGYKKTKIGWIPEEWDVFKVKNIAETTAGGTPSTRISEYWGGNILWMSSGELNYKKVNNVEGRITDLGLKNSSTKLLPKHSILIGLAGQGKTRGTVAYNEVELCTNQSVAAILPNEDKYYFKYLFYNLDCRYDELRKLSTGDGGRGGLNLHIINSLNIPLPPLSEQKKIAEILSTWDKAISNYELLITNYELRKKALMQKLLTGKVRFKEFVGQEWKEVRLKEVSTIKRGAGSQYLQYVEDKHDGIQLLRINDFLNDKPKYVKLTNDIKRFIVHEGDILIAGTGATAGIIYLITKELDGLAHSYNAPRIMLRKSVTISYIYYFLNSQKIQNQQISLFTGNAQHFLDINAIGNFKIDLPLLNEQRKIASVLTAQDKQIDLLKQQKSTLEQQKKGLMQKLLTGEVRVKV
jgi:type I restriction enzyme, S subunit